MTFYDFPVFLYGGEPGISKRMRDKTADFRVRQNSWFWKRDKTTDFDNETKPPILKWDKTADFKVGQNRRFVIIQIANLCKERSCSR